jgi:serine phosphatase RsbU (regulator of sigma subunit)/pSer/pThr/pTyr-binding forkhead associated (FHA) protein
MAYMVALNGPENGKRFELFEGVYVFGRHPDCNIVVDVGAVSRHHCKVYSHGTEFLIQDLESRNGTFVNDQEIEKAVTLRPGDQVRICDVVFSYHDVPSSLSSSSATSILDESSSRVVLVDDDDQSGSMIMSKLDVTSSRGGTQIAASAEAKLNALIQITQSLGQALSLDEVLPQVLDSLFRIFVQADRGFIGLLDESNVLIPRWTKLRREDSQDTIRVSRTIATQVLESRAAILSSDASSDERFDMSQSVADFRIRSMMCAPLLTGDGTAIGILQIDTLDQRQRFQEGDLELLVSAASQAAIAIDNARMHDEALNQKMLERDLNLANEVQRAFLPTGPPEIPGYEFFDYYQAANQVGGDYYDYLPLSKGCFALVVADVVGHGVAAAMLMAKLSAEARFFLAGTDPPALAVTKLNSRLCEMRIDRFVTFIVVVLDPAAHNVVIANAGHLQPLHRRLDGTVQDLGMDATGVPLGIVAGMEYKQIEVPLAVGESLTMLTDGFSEAMDVDGNQYSTERIRVQLRESGGSAKLLGESLLSDVRRHQGERDQDDDMCLLIIRRAE